KNRSISGDVLVTGDDVTIENVRITGEIIIRGSDGTTIKDSSVGAFSISGSTNITAQRLEVFGAPGKDGMHVTSDSGRVRNVLIENSRIHSPKPNPSSHYDGIQVRGVDGLTLRNNSFELGPFKPQ